MRGGADDSYGIEVAKLAGVPNAVIRRAKAVLKELESTMPQIEIHPIEEQEEEDDQMSFGHMIATGVVARLCCLQMDVMTPIEALNALYELKRLAEQERGS